MTSWYDNIPAPVDANGDVVPLTTLQMYDDDGNCGKVGCFNSFIYDQATHAWLVNIDLMSRAVEITSLYLNRP